PRSVYQALVDPTRHSAFTGAPAEMKAAPGGAFSHYAGSLSGFVVALEPDRRIVLAWRADSWPAGAYSIAQFVLRKVANGTRLEFDQFGIPAGDFADIRQGWKTYYWEPLK